MAFVDENQIQLTISRSGLTHVKGWYEQTVCGKFCGDKYVWSYGGLTSLRRLGRMSRNASANRICKQCSNEYKDVRDD